ncbi:MAG: dTDP-4-amino-4,6-dideoxygalactose transaminase [Planctomycetota bacterium]|jgi:dTDP-4-amino-4,6-dideoxygalactose transaminase
MSIPMVDLKGQYQTLKQEIDSAMQAALLEARFILGPNVQAFDQEAADYLGVKHAISCASGTDALHLALLAAGLKAGDEVITTSFTFIATAEAIRYIGAVPVFVDINPDNLNIDVSKIKAAITERTRAILPVHLFGQAADMTEIQAIADDANLLVIEDCAQSFGSRYQDKMTGSIGQAGAFSFFPSKNLGCYGDGGMVTTNDDDIAQQIKIYRNHGSSQQYHHDVIGFNSRLDELQAVILRIKLKRIDDYNQNRLRVAKTYNELLAGSRFETPSIPEDRDHVFHQYTLLCDGRDTIRETVLAADISCAVYYPVPLHQQKAFADTVQPQLAVTEEVSRRCLSFPIFPEMTTKQIETVCQAILSA